MTDSGTYGDGTDREELQDELYERLSHDELYKVLDGTVSEDLYNVDASDSDYEAEIHRHIEDAVASLAQARDLRRAELSDEVLFG